MWAFQANCLTPCNCQTLSLKLRRLPFVIPTRASLPKMSDRSSFKQWTHTSLRGEFRSQIIMAAVKGTVGAAQSKCEQCARIRMRTGTSASNSNLVKWVNMDNANESGWLRSWQTS